MPVWTEIVSAISALAAAITGIVVAAIALRQFIVSKKYEYEAIRPFVIPRLVIETISSEKRLFLDIKNVGDAPAKNLRIVFESEGDWHWVSNPDYPFSNNQGISALGPGESVKYFLGVVRPGNPIADIEKREIAGRVIFDSPISQKEIIDPFRTSLTEKRYKAR